MASGEATTQEDEKEVKKEKLWIGNIDKHLTEYQLVQMLKKFGEIKKFEFLFHMHGPLKGEPRGYCFVEYETKEESTKAMASLQGKKILSRCLIVDWAKQQITTDEDLVVRKKDKKRQQKPREISREKKIEMLEAKLSALEKGKSLSSNSDGTESNSKNQRDLRRESTKPYKAKLKHKLITE